METRRKFPMKLGLKNRLNFVIDIFAFLAMRNSVGKDRSNAKKIRKTFLFIISRFRNKLACDKFNTSENEWLLTPFLNCKKTVAFYLSSKSADTWNSRVGDSRLWRWKDQAEWHHRPHEVYNHAIEKQDVSRQKSTIITNRTRITLVYFFTHRHCFDSLME